MLRNDSDKTKQSDVLEVIANLSNDQVFTPPKIANALLDLLPSEVWTDSTLRWLDPASKTGIFPREITKRLMLGLTEEIPNESVRLEHILKNMVFAIATEKITGMMSRRTLYCTKDASSEFSPVRFATESGNVWHQRIEHQFDKGRCRECGGNREQLERPKSDNNAYGFIHEEGRATIEKEMEMKFDVIIGNPPYQMDAESGNRTMPIYNLFVTEAIKLNPKHLLMIIPSRWMAGGLGLGEFRATMLADKRISSLVDFPNAEDVFPVLGKSIKGGVCYFHWQGNHLGECEVTVVRGDDRHGPVPRNLSANDVLIRDERAIPILEKVSKKKEASITEILSVDKEFGLTSNYNGHHSVRSPGDIEIYYITGGKRSSAWVKGDSVTKSVPLIKKWKTFVPKAGSDGGQKIPDGVLGMPFIGRPPSICTQTYLFFYSDSKAEAESIESYLRTRFFRFLVSLRKMTQDATKSTYTWVPQQTWDRTWTDAELYKKYGITKDEQAYIETMIKEMQP